MYKSFEIFYKKNSPHNVLRKKFIFMYVITVLIYLSFDFFNNNNVLLFITLFIVEFIIYKKICEKVLNTKLTISFDKNDDDLNSLLSKKEKEIIKNYLKDNNYYNKETIKVFLEHYRCQLSTKISSGNFITILSIIVPVVLTFIKDGSFETNNFISSLPIILVFVFFSLVLYFVANKIFVLKSIFDGSYGLISRFEDYFSELYVNFDSLDYSSKKKKRKK